MTDIFRTLLISDIIKDKNQRSEDAEKFAELKRSIDENGLIQPITVSRSSEYEGKYDIITGNRRFSACKELGLTEISAVIMNPLSDIKKAIFVLTENLIRLDLTNTEKCSQLVDIYRLLGFSVEEARSGLYKINNKERVEPKFAKYCKMTGIPVSTQIKLLKLTEIVPEILQSAEEAGLSLDKMSLLTRKSLVKDMNNLRLTNTQNEALRLIKESQNFEEAKENIQLLERDIQDGRYNTTSGRRIFDYSEQIAEEKQRYEIASYDIVDIIYRLRRIIEKITGFTSTEIDEISCKSHMQGLLRNANDRQVTELKSYLSAIIKTANVFNRVIEEKVIEA